MTIRPYFCMDSGPDLISLKLSEWAKKHAVKPEVIHPCRQRRTLSLSVFTRHTVQKYSIFISPEGRSKITDTIHPCYRLQTQLSLQVLFWYYLFELQWKLFHASSVLVWCLTFGAHFSWKGGHLRYQYWLNGYIRRSVYAYHQCHAQTRRVNGSKEPCRDVRAL